MNEKLNPFFSSEKLGLQMISAEESNMSYEFNTFCFWSTEDGKVYFAEDAGGSVPVPFESYEGTTQEEVLALLQRVKNVEHGIACFDDWNESIYEADGRCGLPERECLKAWLKRAFARKPKKVAAPTIAAPAKQEPPKSTFVVDSEMDNMLDDSIPVGGL